MAAFHGPVFARRAHRPVRTNTASPADDLHARLLLPGFEILDEDPCARLQVRRRP